VIRSAVVVNEVSWAGDGFVGLRAPAIPPDGYTVEILDEAGDPMGDAIDLGGLVPSEAALFVLSSDAALLPDLQSMSPTWRSHSTGSSSSAIPPRSSSRPSRSS
jgi:hypothetical protein